MANIFVAIQTSLSAAHRVVLFMLLFVVVLSCVGIILLLKTNADLEKKAKKAKEENEAKADQILRISHDVRGALNVIMGYSSMLEDQEDLSPEIREDMGKIYDSSRYLENLINDMTDVSKIEQGKVELNLQTVNGIEFLGSIAKFYAKEAKRKGINLEYSFDLTAGEYVVLDEVKSRRIYSNLLSNAIKYSQAGTCIKWTVKDEPLASDKVTMVSVIEDQGCGMSQEFMEKMFEPFTQEMNYQGNGPTGTGLGLAIVKSLVELMGGTISAESQLGVGTKFTIAMERNLGKAAEVTEEVGEAPVNVEGLMGKKVLLCEDRPLNMQIMTMMLERCGMEVTTATNGRQGVDKFKASPEGCFAAVIMDSRMPVMDGLQATKEIRKLKRSDAKTVPIVAVTGGIYDGLDHESSKAGVTEQLIKPVSQDQLSAVLSRLVCKKQDK